MNARLLNKIKCRIQTVRYFVNYLNKSIVSFLTDVIIADEIVINASTVTKLNRVHWRISRNSRPAGDGGGGRASFFEKSSFFFKRAVLKGVLVKSNGVTGNSQITLLLSTSSNRSENVTYGAAFRSLFG